jgi:hypothetical protein
MEKNIEVKKVWFIIIVFGVLSFIYGFYFHSLFFEAIGVISSVSALACALSDIFIKIIRRKHGERFK